MAYIDGNVKLEDEKSQRGIGGAIKGQLTIWDIEIKKGPPSIAKADDTIPTN